LDVDEERPQRVIGARQDLVVPKQRDHTDQRCAPSTGAEDLPTPDALAFMASLRLVGARWLNVYSTATSTAIGSVHRDDERNRQREHFEMDAHGSPCDEVPNCFATWLTSIANVSAASA